MSRVELFPVFLVGCPRSGTSVTKKVLREHPSLYTCGVEHHYILELADRFGDRRFSYEEGLDALARCSFSFAEQLPSVHPGCGDVFDVPSFCQLIWQIGASAPEGGSVLLQYAGVGLLRWADLVRLFPNARFVILTRDPRANVSSQVVSFANGRTFNRSVNLWKECRLATKALAAKHPARVAEILYEDLVREPLDALRAIVTFLGFEWDETLLDFDVPMSVAGSDGVVEHRRYKSFDADMLDKYRDAMTPAQISLVEWRCRSGMDELGYARDGRLVRPSDVPFLVSDGARWLAERAQVLVASARS